MITRIIRLPATTSFFLFGPRQTGKSTLVDTNFREKVWKIELLHSDLFMDYSMDPSLFRREAQVKLERDEVSVIGINEIHRVPLLSK